MEKTKPADSPSADIQLTPDALMARALRAAAEAGARGEVPIGAVLATADGTVWVAANAVEETSNPLAHAEMRVLEMALADGRRYLQDCTLAVTLEPCAMCMAALCHARVGNVVFGAYDVKSGGTVNGARVAQHMHFKPAVLGGIKEADAAEMLAGFFKGLR